jgi:flagellar biosynthesis/type III secretory pathway M-ring protein FliF/YscJ
LERTRKIQEIRGDSSRGGIVLAGVLAVVLVVVLLLWMRDRESREFQVEIGSDEPTIIHHLTAYRV